MATEEKDESFEIISIKEKYLRDQFTQAEDALMKSEFGVRVNKEIVRVAEAELKKEQMKNKPSMVD